MLRRLILVCVDLLVLEVDLGNFSRQRSQSFLQLGDELLSLTHDVLQLLTVPFQAVASFRRRLLTCACGLLRCGAHAPIALLGLLPLSLPMW